MIRFVFEIFLEAVLTHRIKKKIHTNITFKVLVQIIVLEVKI